MRRSIDELRTFYGEPTGALVRRLLARRLSDAWGTASNCDVLGLGYATPWLDGFSDARRVIAAMPGGQGAEHYASAARNRSVLVDERRLPFASGLFDRILMVHAIEEADDPQAILIEAARTLSPSGRLIVATAARGGLWARTEATPFGHGRPFSRRQLENLVRGAALEPSAWSPAVYVPPWRPLLGFADGFEQAGRVAFPGAAGLILLEASRRNYARPRPKGNLVVLPRPTLAPAPSGATRQSHSTGVSRDSELEPQRKPLYGGVPCTD
ncbi:class I SAM-dependent methyltransferase [Brevundimonas sp.]|uniref:class I SAM-dependent methyltransferase n=1 Tax=Brevundimonas sp. TaxID=1871086 RepID=UPI002897F9E5|nr:class I SAM-dependent methyltransferase [Brevundimonas sp.]